ncbi:MAG: DUF6268 family outer membrane beta-barrel protein [Planctomycetota bacterium]
MATGAVVAVGFGLAAACGNAFAQGVAPAPSTPWPNAPPSSLAGMAAVSPAAAPARGVGGTAWTGPPALPATNATPPVGRPLHDPAFRLAEAPSLPVADPLGIEAQRQTQDGLPPGTRAGVFQKAHFVGSYLPRFEPDGLGIGGLDASVVFGVPFPERRSPLLITPRYRLLLLDGPDFTDVPPRVHEAEVGLSHFRRISERWMFNSAVTLGAYADDHSFDSSDAFRVTGRALGIYDITSRWKGVVGVVYLNRAGLSVVPAAGLTYDSGAFKMDLIFPRPRLAWLLPGSTPTAGDQRWFYVQGEIGGNIWAVQRASGAGDALSYGDARVLIGYERKLLAGVTRRVELGYIFNRELEFDSEGSVSEIDDTLLLRTGVTY